MAKINVDFNFNSAEALKRIAELEAKANQASKAFLKMSAATGHKIGLADIKDFQKTIAQAEKLNQVLNNTPKIVSANAKAFDKMTASIIKGVTAVELMKKGLGFITSLLGKGFHIAADFATEGYNSALELNQEKAMVRTQWSREGQPVDKRMESMDKVAHTLLEYGVEMKDTFSSARFFANIFPKANQVAQENFVKAANLLAIATGKSSEQATSQLKLVESSLDLNRMTPGRMNALGIPLELQKTIQNAIKEFKKTGQNWNPEKWGDIIEKTIIREQGAQAKAKLMEDPLWYFNYKMKEASNTLGQTLLTIFKTPQMQKAFDNIIEMVNKFIKSFGDDPNKLADIISSVINGFMRLTGAVMAVIEFIEKRLGKSQYQKDREFTSLNEFNNRPEVRPLYDAYRATLSEAPTIQHILESVENVKSGKTDLSLKTTAQPVIDYFTYLMKNYTGKVDLNKTLNGVREPTSVTATEGKSSRGLSGNKSPFDIANETSKVTGSRAVTININIGKQVETLNVNAASITESRNEIEDTFIRLLDDALMSAESIIGR